MLNVEHSDNLCNVGWTCIWANMTPEDMQSLLDSCPKGSFMPTFYDPDRQGYKWTPELLREHLKENFPDVRSWRPSYTLTPQPWWAKSRGFYFNFSIDEQGIELLRKLGFDPSKCRFWDEYKQKQSGNAH